MPNAKQHLFLYAMCAFAAIHAPMLSGCDRTQEHDPDMPVIVVSISPLAQLVQAMTQDVATVHTLLPSGVSPHGFSMTANQMRQISRADVIVLNGLGLDQWAVAGIQRAANPQAKHVEVAQILGVEGEGHDCHDHAHSHHDHAHNGPNPHFWIDPVLMKQFVHSLSQDMQTWFPEHADKVQANTTPLLEKLDVLDQSYRTRLGDVPRKQMVTFHNAFDLLAKQYGLEIVSHLAEVDLVGLSITPGEVARAIQMINQYDLVVLYAEPKMPEEAIKAVRERTGVDVLILDPMESSGKAYFEQMEKNLDTLVKGQSMKRE